MLQVYNTMIKRPCFSAFFTNYFLRFAYFYNCWSFSAEIVEIRHYFSMEMNKSFLKNTGIFLIFLAAFWAISTWYLNPALDGYMLKQGDMQQVRLMKHAAEQVKAETGAFPKWNDRLFSGMPSSLITGIEQGSVILKWRVVELFGLVKSPFNFLFVAMVSMFVLLLSVRVDRWLAAAGAIGYAFMTFSISSYEAGHITKVLSMGVMPGVFAGLVYLNRGKYLLGTALTSFFFAALVGYFHYQIVYYAGIMMVVYFVVQWVMAALNKNFKSVLTASILAALSAGLGTVTCIGKLKDTNDYAKETMRGGSAVADDANGAPKAAGTQVSKKGLDMDYAFAWSYSLDESFTLLIPGFKGGSSGELVNDERFGEARLPLYFGNLQFTSGPVYLGAVMMLLFIVGCVIAFVDYKADSSNEENRLFLGLAIFGLASLLISLMLSWGKYLGLNAFLFDNLPYYNKFRTPMMALVIAQVVVPLVGFMGIGKLVNLMSEQGLSAESRKKFWTFTLGIAGGLMGLAILITMGGDVSAPEDARLLEGENGRETLNAVKELRGDLVWGDIMRSLALMGMAVGVVWGILTKKINGMVAGIACIVLVGYDMLGVSKRYLTDENWEVVEEEEAIMPTPGDEAIMQMNKDGKRVIDYRAGINRTFNDNTLGAFHRSIGGYHPAKMSRYQDVITYCIGASGPTGSGDLMNNNALDMLNCGYILGITQDNKQEIPVDRPTALGHAWFVDSVIKSTTAKQALMDINVKNIRRNAIFDPASESPQTVVFSRDSSSKITRLSYTNDSIEYLSNNASEGLAVFSEIYYNQKNGAWKVYIDGKESKAYRANYILRSAIIPAGKHNLKWVYVPEDRSLLVTLEAGASFAILLLLLAPFVLKFLNKQ